MCDWVCYLIMSLDSNDTYIGSSNNQPNRLIDHNNNDPSIKRRGAKRTRGQTWIPIVIISGFHHKNACLSFEAGWKRLYKKRNNNRLDLINFMTNLNLRYSDDTKWNRIIDLLYFTHNFTMIDTKFMLNYDMRHPLFEPEELTINIFMEDWISDLPWPHFVSTKIVAFKN
ncbi:putative endo/excinuclease amino terminal domain protein [Tupanvirus soda lake]|uniref:Endo/excinuclease amino terminal domain protein n=2 Tax=Tupanvirus TaxID=2094720 RepID=A0AC62ABQ3_9VIRU|nr:putative endo/excinuclease amino terminal domain protein [Tupanvirus soda lake]QKU35033.1 putative endo/excinuclease amino terminal domain protein [Tupanvirus soda lake]